MGGEEISVQDKRRNYIFLYFSDEAVILITVHRHDVSVEVSAIHRQLRSALLQIVQNSDITISRFGKHS